MNPHSTATVSALVLCLLLTGCNEVKSPMTPEQMRAAVTECQKYGMKTMFWRSFNYRIVEASCEPVQ